ncbi:MAG TPA: hypothetical protein VM408_01250 [Methylomirabilota bacterium]|nr:hypothetical protein [Methylomirabilota bacterium]
MRIAERMAGDLRDDEGTWLDEHVTGCAACAGLATQYAADRDALRTLRDIAPEPPRDLWARTAAAIEREAGGPAPREAGRRPSRIPIGALSGIAVIAVVVGVSTLSGGFFTPNQAPLSEKPSDMTSTTGGEAGSEPGIAQATPFSVSAGEVQWVDTAANGSLGYNKAPVDEVCPTEDTSACPTLEDASREGLAIVNKPHTIIESPTNGKAVAVSDAGAGGGDELIIFDLPEASPTPRSTPSESPTPTPTPVLSASPTASAPASPSAPSSAEPTSATPSAPDASESPTPSPSPVDTTATPSEPPAPSPTPSPLLSPTPSIAANIAIASDIELVGESAAFSADGRWFAFTARPDDRSRGPDVYLWQVGDASARPITTDGTTVFASWDGNEIVASRPRPMGSKSAVGDAVPDTIRIDPATGTETPAGDVWRPVVDPTRTRAIGWNGSLTESADGATWAPGVGKLELSDWTAGGADTQANGQDGRVVADAAAAGFDVRWDEAGDWVAIWVADPGDPSVGRLSLYEVDTARGTLDLPKDAPAGVPALPGFSIGEGRLAWATPPGQNGEGSRVHIVAWNEDGVGAIESAPGEDVIIIR